MVRRPTCGLDFHGLLTDNYHKPTLSLPFTHFVDRLKNSSQTAKALHPAATAIEENLIGKFDLCVKAEQRCREKYENLTPTLGDKHI